MYFCATRLMNLVLPKAFIQLFHMQVHTPYMQARCDILFQIRLCKFSCTLRPTIKHPAPKLQHVISKTVSIMWKTSSQFIRCGNWELQEVRMIWWSLTSVLLGQIWVACLWRNQSKIFVTNFSKHLWHTART